MATRKKKPKPVVNTPEQECDGILNLGEFRRATAHLPDTVVFVGRASGAELINFRDLSIKDVAVVCGYGPMNYDNLQHAEDAEGKDNVLGMITVIKLKSCDG